MLPRAESEPVSEIVPMSPRRELEPTGFPAPQAPLTLPDPAQVPPDPAQRAVPLMAAVSSSAEATAIAPPTATRRVGSWLRALLIGAFLGVCALLALFDLPHTPLTRRLAPPEQRAPNTQPVPRATDIESTLEPVLSPLAAATARPAWVVVPLASAGPLLMLDSEEDSAAFAPTWTEPEAMRGAPQRRGRIAAHSVSASPSAATEPPPYVIDFSPIPADVSLSIGDHQITGFGTLLLNDLPEIIQLVARREGYQTRILNIGRNTFTEQNGVRWRRLYVTLRTNEEVAAMLDRARN
jgi:hypothetical protein